MRMLDGTETLFPPRGDFGDISEQSVGDWLWWGGSPACQFRNGTTFTTGRYGTGNEWGLRLWPALRIS